jgi:hypothetical protein
MRQGFLLDSNKKSAKGKSKIMAMLTDAEERILEIGTKKLSNMESNIVDTMRRYFTVGPGTERDNMEIAIIDASKRYFEGHADG